MVITIYMIIIYRILPSFMFYAFYYKHQIKKIDINYELFSVKPIFLLINNNSDFSTILSLFYSTRSKIWCNLLDQSM